MLSHIDIRHRVTAPGGRFEVEASALQGIALHHSASGDYLTAAASESREIEHIQAIDRHHVEQEFGGIGYHMAVFASGRTYLLGDLGGARAHVAGRNHELLGIVAIGTFTERQVENRQLAALRKALEYLRRYAGRDLPVQGHARWALPGQGTLCPGRLDEIDWDAPSMPATTAMVRFNGIARTLEGRTLPDGLRGGILDAASEFSLPPGARMVRIEVALRRGGFALGDGTYAGRVDEGYGSRLGIIDAQLLPDGSLAYDCPPGTEIERIGCLGYWT